MDFISVVFLFFIVPFFFITYYFSPDKFKNFVILLFSFLILFWGSPRLFIYFIGISFFNYIAGYFILKFNKKIFKIIFIFFVLIFEVAQINWVKNRNYCYVYFFKDYILDELYLSIFFMNNISYLLDAYKNRFKFSKNIVDYFLYIFMFFKFFAGPIIPYYKIKNEIQKRNVSVENVVKGIERLIFGLFKISVLSHEIGEIRKFICSRGSQEISFFSAVVAAICIFFNFYFYFSGYCDMANGFLKITGFSYVENFGERIFHNNITKFFKYFNKSFTNYLKFYVFPWSRNRDNVFKFFKYLLVMFFYWFVFSWRGFNDVIFKSFVFIFLEKLFLNKILLKLPKFLRKIYCQVLIVVLFAPINFIEKGEGKRFISYLFGSSGILLDYSFAFVIMFFKFLIVLGCFFGLKRLFFWLKKPKKKYVNLFRVVEKVIYLSLLFVSIVYCLNV